MKITIAGEQTDARRTHNEVQRRKQILHEDEDVLLIRHAEHSFQDAREFVWLLVRFQGLKVAVEDYVYAE